MNLSVSTPPERQLWGVSMIVAPSLFAVSTFFWHNGEYTITGGTLLVVATAFWIPAFIGLFTKLKMTMPRYAVWGLLVAIFGCISGSNFGMRGIYAEVFGISKEELMREAAAHSVSFNITMFQSGPLFPLSLLVLGINLTRKEVVPKWVGTLICVGAIVFPVSRISRVDGIAHVADLLLFIPIAYLGWKMLMPNQGASQTIFPTGSY
ncbi:hypothetical protein GCM10027341_15620 [Spirosoma knui]